MKKHVAIALSLAIGTSSIATAYAAQPPALPAKQATAVAMPNPVLLTVAEIQDIRSRPADFKALVQKCTTEIDYAPNPVATLAPDPHYTSTGVNPSANNGKQLATDSQAAYRQGLCYVVTGDTRFAIAAQRIIDGWATTLKAVTTEQGKSNINFNLPYMIAAANWSFGVSGWQSVEFDKFLRNVVLPNSATKNNNNHGMWAMLMEASAAVHFGDMKMLDTARARWIEILKGAASSDGTLIREVERSNTNNWRDGPDKGKKGVAYTHYFMLPASMAAKIFADQCKPVWNEESGMLLKAVFEKSAGWAVRPESFPFYASNNGDIDRGNIVHFPLLLRVYPNADAEAAVKTNTGGDGGFLLPKLYAAAASKKPAKVGGVATKRSEQKQKDKNE